MRTEPLVDDSTRNMVWLPGGLFQMGSDRHYLEEAPVHRVTVGAFWIDRAPVTNRQFRRFVEATGYVTLAEIAPNPMDYPGALPHMQTSPVGAFPANGYGVFDMIGNVWEWTADWFSARHAPDPPKACCIPENPRGGPEVGSYDQCTPSIRIPRKVVKGGSFLCAPNYCRRYRPAARHAQPIDTGMSHVGFRCVLRRSATSHPAA